MISLESYLFELGLVGDEISSTTLEQAKKAYRKQYLKEYMQSYRQQKIRKDISFSQEEFELISASAKKHKQKFAQHLKKLALAYLNQEYIVIDESIFKSLIFEIRAIGRNINQIAFKLNQGKFDSFNEEELHTQLIEFERAIEEAIKRPQLSKTILNDTDS